MLDKRKLRRDIERERRRKARAKLLEIRALIKTARAERKLAIQKVKSDCAAARIALRSSCSARRDQAKLDGSTKVAWAREQLTLDQAYENLQRSAFSGPKPLRSTRTERRQESDDEVRSNISADLVPLFNSVKQFIKGSPRRTRTEAFVEYVQEHPEDAYQALDTEAERYLRQLLAEEKKQARLSRAGRLSGSGAVPF